MFVRDRDMLREFKAELKIATDGIEPGEPDQLWDQLCSAYTEAAEKVIPKIPERRKCYISEATWSLIGERKVAYTRMIEAKLRPEYLEKQ
jgi:hypothetical protein